MFPRLPRSQGSGDGLVCANQTHSFKTCIQKWVEWGKRQVIMRLWRRHGNHGFPLDRQFPGQQLLWHGRLSCKLTYNYIPQQTSWLCCPSSNRSKFLSKLAGMTLLSITEGWAQHPRDLGPFQLFLLASCVTSGKLLFWSKSRLLFSQMEFLHGLTINCM